MRRLERCQELPDVFDTFENDQPVVPVGRGRERKAQRLHQHWQGDTVEDWQLEAGALSGRHEPVREHDELAVPAERGVRR